MESSADLKSAQADLITNLECRDASRGIFFWRWPALLLLGNNEAGQRIAVERSGLPGVRIPLTVGGADNLYRQDHCETTKVVLLRDAVVDQPPIYTDCELRRPREIAPAGYLRLGCRSRLCAERVAARGWRLLGHDLAGRPKDPADDPGRALGALRGGGAAATSNAGRPETPRPGYGSHMSGRSASVHRLTPASCAIAPPPPARHSQM